MKRPGRLLSTEPPHDGEEGGTEKEGLSSLAENVWRADMAITEAGSELVD